MKWKISLSVGLNLGLICSMCLINISEVFSQDTARGKTLYQACIQCHGENGEGNPSQKAPKLSGQFGWYVEKQITDFKSGARKNPPMLPFIGKLTEQDIKDLAAYIVTL